MSSRYQTLEKFRRPELFLVELLKKSVQGQLHDNESNVPVLFRAAVVAVDVIGGRLENEGAQGEFDAQVDGRTVKLQATDGPPNPRNSLKARILNNGFDQFFSNDQLRTFWPMFPEHISLPVKPGEHVYVMFEDRDWVHGLWFSKISGHNNLNLFKGRDSFTYNRDDSPGTNAFPDMKTEQDFERSDKFASESHDDGAERFFVGDTPRTQG